MIKIWTKNLFENHPHGLRALLNMKKYWPLDSKLKDSFLTKIIIYDHEWCELNFDELIPAGTSMREHKKTQPFRQFNGMP